MVVNVVIFRADFVVVVGDNDDSMNMFSNESYVYNIIMYNACDYAIASKHSRYTDHVYFRIG